jgi:hypothetical protein
MASAGAGVSASVPVRIVRFNWGGGKRMLLETVQWLSVLVGLVAAALALRAATVYVRDSIDDFIGDIHRQSFWATWSAVATSVTALLLVVQTFLD